MSAPSDFLSHGLEQARYALVNIIGSTSAQLRPVTLPRSRLRRARGRLVQLEIIVRRLLMLMALALRLPPVIMRASSVQGSAPDGVEIVSFPAPRRFALSARLMGQGWDADGQRPSPAPGTRHSRSGPAGPARRGAGKLG